MRMNPKMQSKKQGALTLQKKCVHSNYQFSVTMSMFRRSHYRYPHIGEANMQLNTGSLIGVNGYSY